MANKKIIIGLVGQLACGKGTVAEYLKKNTEPVSTVIPPCSGMF